MTELPTIRTRNDVYENFPNPFAGNTDDSKMKQSIDEGTVGILVRIIGEYRQVDVRYRKYPTPEYEGHVKIVLDDGTGIFFYPPWHSRAIRPSEEIAQFENKRVVVEGKILPEIPPYSSPSLKIT